MKAVGADTDGDYTLIEIIVEPQVGPPRHLHRCEVEVFYVLEGTLGFQIGNGVRRFARWKDAIAMYQNNAAKIAQEIEAWLPVATSTDHDHRITA